MGLQATRTHIFLAFILMVLLTLLNAMHAFRLGKLAMKFSDANERNFTYEGDDFPNRLPVHFQPAIMIFNTTTRYGLHDPHDWDSMTPRGHGWVLLGPKNRAFAVTMYHQLHCLNAMRYDLTQSEKGKDPTEARLGHAHHCYNYVRQGLLCGGDGILEPSPDGLVGQAAEGEGVAHVCKDWVQIRHYMEEIYDQHQSDGYDPWAPQ